MNEVCTFAAPFSMPTPWIRSKHSSSSPLNSMTHIHIRGDMMILLTFWTIFMHSGDVCVWVCNGIDSGDEQLIRPIQIECKSLLTLWWFLQIESIYLRIWHLETRPASECDKKTGPHSTRISQTYRFYCIPASTGHRSREIDQIFKLQ